MALQTYKVTQTRTIEIVAPSPGDACDLARYVFRGEKPPTSDKGGPAGEIARGSRVKITALNVERRYT